jgi:hypothetical protein
MKLYEEIAEHLGITAKEVQIRVCNGETIVQAYYEWKYNWDPKNASSIPF